MLGMNEVFSKANEQTPGEKMQVLREYSFWCSIAFLPAQRPPGRPQPPPKLFLVGLWFFQPWEWPTENKLLVFGHRWKNAPAQHSSFATAPRATQDGALRQLNLRVRPNAWERMRLHVPVLISTRRRVMPMLKSATRSRTLSAYDSSCSKAGRFNG